MKEHIHVTKEGTRIPLSELADSHLLNILNWIWRMSKQGITLAELHGSSADIDSFDYDERTIKGKKARKHLRFKAYTKEAERRGWVWAKSCEGIIRLQ